MEKKTDMEKHKQLGTPNIDWGWKANLANLHAYWHMNQTLYIKWLAMAMSKFWYQQHHHFTVSCHATSKTQCALGHGVFLRKRRNRFPRWWQKALVLVSFWNGILSKLNDWGWASSGWWFQPLWKIWVRQLGWWHSQYMEKTCSKPPTRSPSYSHCCWFIAY